MPDTRPSEKADPPKTPWVDRAPLPMIVLVVLAFAAATVALFGAG